jgi:hypothetical protein
MSVKYTVAGTKKSPLGQMTAAVIAKGAGKKRTPSAEDNKRRGRESQTGVFGVRCRFPKLSNGVRQITRRIFLKNAAGRGNMNAGNH